MPKVFRAIHAHYNVGHRVNMQLIKIPTTSYVDTTLKIWGHDSTRHMERKYSNTWANGGNPNVKGKTHKTINYPFYLLCQIIDFFQKLVELVDAWGWEEYGSQIQIWKATHFCENMFWLLVQVKTHKCMPIPLCIHVHHFFTQLKVVDDPDGDRCPPTYSTGSKQLSIVAVS